ncbi:hypothetical protein ACLBWX_00995 [Methylobacterium sp. M6A4_1b]
MTSSETSEAGTAGSLFDLSPAPPSPHIAIGAGIGLGKTEAALRAIHRAVTDDRSSRFAVFVPTHVTADDIAVRLNRMAGEIVAAVWRGTGRPDPTRPQRLMCPMHPLVDQVRTAGGDVRDVCGSGKAGCDHHPLKPDQIPGNACAYRQQFDAGISVWIMPHAMLTSAAPDVFMTAERKRLGYPVDVVVIDEAPWLSCLGGCDPKNPVQIRVEDVVHLPRCPEGGAGRAEYLGIARRLAIALKGQEGLLKRDPFVEAGLWPGAADRAAALTRGLQAALPIRRDLPAEAAAAALKADGSGSGATELVRRLWTEVSTFLRSGASTAPHTLQLATDDEGHSVVRLRWKDEIHRDWADGPILHLDATIVPEVARRWLPHLRVEAQVRASETNVYRVALIERAFGKSGLVGGGSEARKRLAANRRERVLHFVEVQAFLHRGRGRLMRDGTRGPDVALAGNKELVDALRPHLPPNVALLHFNGSRGYDGLGGVSAMVTVGRPEASVQAVEQCASIAFGELIPPCGERWYPSVQGAHLMIDGSGRRIPAHAHPDPRAEAFRRQVATELEQTEGRARGVRRGPENPLTSFLVTNAQTDLPLDAAVTEDEMLDVPLVLLLFARGLVPDTSADAAKVLHDIFGTDAKGAAAFRQRIGREGNGGLAPFFASSEAGRSAGGGEVVTGLLENYLTSVTGSHRQSDLPPRALAWPAAVLAFRCFRYRAHDRRTSGLALVDTVRHADPEAALQGVVGQLVSFASVESPAWLESVQTAYRDERHKADAVYQMSVADPTPSLPPVELTTTSDPGPTAAFAPQAASTAVEPTMTIFEIASELGVRPQAFMHGPKYKQLERAFGREKAGVMKLVMRFGAEAVQAAGARCLARSVGRQA